MNSLIGSFGGIEFASIKFFEPKEEEFIKAMQQFKQDCIFDVGCGMGHIVDLLMSKDFKCLGIDNNYREGQSELIIEANAVTFDFLENSILMFCRPCHDGFPEVVLKNNIGKIKAFIYIGFEKNLENDLGIYSLGLINKGIVGKEGEIMLVKTL